jgi:superfamily II DNA or RNA helicase
MLKELCDILSIPTLIYSSTGQKVNTKSGNIVTFRTTQVYRVLLLDLATGSHGLDVSTASRIYFTHPVPSDSLFQQAIKRAHRLGCEREVHVQVLEFCGSVEETEGIGMMDKNREEVGANEKDTKSVRALRTKAMVESAPFVLSQKRLDAQSGNVKGYASGGFVNRALHVILERPFLI